MGDSLSSFLDHVIKAINDQNFDEAAFIIRRAIEVDLANFSSFFDLGIAFAKANKFREAVTIFCSLQGFKKNDARIPYNLGLIHSLQGNHRSALDAYDLALEIQPNDVATLINKGSVYNDIKNFNLALKIIENAIEIRPDIPEAWFNKGIALNNLNLCQESLVAYDKAIHLRPNYYEAYSNKSIPLNKLKRFLEASEACKKALALKPDYAEAWSNKGVTLHELKRFEEAIFHHGKALALKPDYAEAWSNKGVTLHELKRFEEAIFHYGKALALKPDYAEAWSNKGVTLHELKRFEEAIACFDQAIKLKPDIDWVYGYLLSTRMQICSWSDLEESIKIACKKIIENKKVCEPFSLLGLHDVASLHRKSSEIYVESKHPYAPTLGEILRVHEDQRIRIGYFSADFHNHATGYLIAEILEMSDKSRFELIGFSFGSSQNDAMNQRLQKSFNEFIEVGDSSDIEIARFSRDLKIDIAVDLKGFTKESRTDIFSYRAAPIQVNWLGYPGTMGASYFDYIIADRVLIPTDSQPCFSEKIVYLPNSYQPNDRKRLISERKFTRQDFGLANDAFVFCCFNNTYKIQPDIFRSWMRILNAVGGSVLWLFKDNPQAVANLKKEALAHGIDSSRLIFAEPMNLADHLARHRQADLFLDTFPYNAHTTASDALWASLPVVTLIGQSFASRVAASLLNSVGLTELITSSLEEYESVAIKLANNPLKLKEIKSKLEDGRTSAPLFNSSMFAKNLESAYLKMYRRFKSNLAPDHLYIN